MRSVPSLQPGVLADLECNTLPGLARPDAEHGVAGEADNVPAGVVDVVQHQTEVLVDLGADKLGSVQVLCEHLRDFGEPCGWLTRFGRKPTKGPGGGGGGMVTEGETGRKTTIINEAEAATGPRKQPAGAAETTST